MSTELILARGPSKREATDASSAQELNVIDDRPPLFDVSQGISTSSSNP